MGVNKVLTKQIWYIKSTFFVGLVSVGLVVDLCAQRPLAAGKSKFLGAGTKSPVWSRFNVYWNQITPGNDGKWGSVEYVQGQYSFANLDSIYSFALRHNIPFKQHTLIWGQQQPSWITALDSSAQRLAIERWIDTVAKRYPQTAYVDVVNEPFNAPPLYKNALGGNGTTGWDWVITAFQLARKAYPLMTKLLLNEYNVLHSNTVTTNYLTLINLLKTRGLIDGIGIQGHYFEFRSDIGKTPSYIYDINVIKTNLNRLIATGLPVYITEFDVDEPNDSNQVAQYKIYFPLFWNNPGVKGITLWGYHYDDVWASHPNTYVIDARGKERPVVSWLRYYCSLPFTPVLVLPLNGSTNVDINPKLIWKSSESAKAYRVQISTFSHFPPGSIFIDTIVVDTVLSLLPLTPSTTYYWRVRAQNDSGESEYSSVYGFTTGNTYRSDTVRVVSDSRTGRIGNLNRVINTINTISGALSRTVFLLELNSRYILDNEILVPPGEHLTIIAPDPGRSQETAPPQILLSNKSKGSFTMIRCYGHLTLKNVWLFCAFTEGYQAYACIIFKDTTDQNVHRCFLENVILDFFGVSTVSSSAITVTCRNFRGTFKNCYWKNCVDPHLRYYGRAISFPYQSEGHHIDTLIFENCTFANIGYVLNQENENYADVVKFNHCTFYNVVMYPLQSGWWYKLAVTNSLFANCWIYGWIPCMTVFNSNTGQYEPDGVFRIDSITNFGFLPQWAKGVENPEQERRIVVANCSYSLDPWLVRWMLAESNSAQVGFLFNEKAKIPLPQPMFSWKTLAFFESRNPDGTKRFPFIRKEHIYNGVEDSLLTYPWPWGNTLIIDVPEKLNELIKHDSYNPNFVRPALDTLALKKFIDGKWYSCFDTLWAWKVQNSFNYMWPLEENFSYTNSILKTAAMSGYPLGDLYRWWPELYDSWKSQAGSEEALINQYLVGVEKETSIKVPAEYMLFLNYPNPFNPTTTIVYEIPIKSHVTIKVYDLLGREVATLVDAIQPPQRYSFQWNTTVLSSGVYFCRLNVQTVDGKSHFSAVRKFVVVK
ncbi:MAG: endo-1,4-beta-xylanase [Bacteroidetes bacterium]|nr:endo-1,4-beta-xylanase [Bacteroidota bacterium]